MERGAQLVIAFWHQLVLDLQLADYSRVNDEGDEISNPENPGPCYSSRAMAMTHLAMYDAYVGVTQEAETYLTYAQLPPQPPGTSTTNLPSWSHYHTSFFTKSYRRSALQCSPMWAPRSFYPLIHCHTYHKVFEEVMQPCHACSGAAAYHRCSSGRQRSSAGAAGTVPEPR